MGLRFPSIVAAVALVLALLPAGTAGADTRIDPSIQSTRLTDCLDFLDDRIRFPAIEASSLVPSASTDGGCGGGVGLPADVNVDLSGCVENCIVRELPLLDVIRDRIPVDVPQTYSVECVAESGNTQVSTGETLVNTEPRCPIPGLDTGSTTAFLGGFTEHVPVVEGLDDVPTEVATTGLCELTVGVTTDLGPSAQTTQLVQCVDF